MEELDLCPECCGRLPLHNKGCYLQEGDGEIIKLTAPNSLIAPEFEEQYALQESDQHLKVRNVEALEDLADGVLQIGNFLCNGGLTKVLSGYARTQSVQGILNGLAAHDGRKSLDARVLSQNALEIVEQVEAVFKKYDSRMKQTDRDTEIHDAEPADLHRVK